MAVESDNESLHSGGSVVNVDENRTGGNDLTVKIPASSKADSRRSSKPVKLKRKNYEVSGKLKPERDAKADEQEPVILHSKAEISSSYPASLQPALSSYPASLQPEMVNPPQHNNEYHSEKAMQSFQEHPVTNADTNHREDTRDVDKKRRFPSSRGKSPLPPCEVNSFHAMQVDKSGGNNRLNDPMKRRSNEGSTNHVNDKATESSVKDGKTNSQLNKVSNSDETIKVSIGDGKLRSSMLVSKNVDSFNRSVQSGQVNDGNQSSTELVDMTTKYDDIGSSSNLDSSQTTDTNHPETTSTRRDSRGDEVTKGRQTPERSRSSPDRYHRSHHKDNRERSGREQRTTNRDEQKRERKRSPVRHGSPNRSRSPYSRNSGGYSRRRGLAYPRRQLERGRRGSFDYRRGRFGSIRGGGRGYAGRRGGPLLPNRRYPERRNDRNRSQDRVTRRRNSSPKETRRSRSDDSKSDRMKKEAVKKSKKAQKPSKKEIEKMEEELKKIDLMIEIRKTKKKTGEKLAWAEVLDKSSKGDPSNKLSDGEQVQVDVGTAINVAIHSCENSPLGPANEAVHKPSKITEIDLEKGDVDGEDEEQASNQYIREVSKLDHMITSHDKSANVSSKSDDISVVLEGTKYGESDSENIESAGECNDEEQEKECGVSSSSSDGDSETGSNKEGVKLSQSENSGKELEMLDDKEANSSSDSDDESNKSSSTSDASDGSRTGVSEKSDTDESVTSEESEPVQKKRSKKKKSRKKKRQSSVSDNDSDLSDDSDVSGKSAKKKKKKRKKKKKKKKSKRHSRKHKKENDKSIVMNESQFSAFLDKVKESLRDEIVKELHQQPPTGKEASRKKGAKEEIVDSKDAEVNYSSDELDIAMSTHHGFPTGIPLRKDEEELGESKGSDDNFDPVEEVFKVFKSDDELDDELEEENWKRLSRKAEEKNEGSGSKYSRNEKVENGGKNENKSHGNPGNTKRYPIETEGSSNKSKKGLKDNEYSSKGEMKSRKRVSDHHTERSSKEGKQSRSEESMDDNRERKAIQGESEKVDMHRDKRKSSPGAGYDSSEKSNQYGKRSGGERHHGNEMHLPVNKGPVDGIAIANQVRNDVYKLNDFWSGSARKRPIDIGSTPFSLDEHSENRKENASIESGGGRWEAPFADINNRLQKIAGHKYGDDEHNIMRRKSSDVDKIDDIEKRPLPVQQNGEKDSGKIKEKEGSSRIYKDGDGRPDSALSEKGKIKKEGRRYSGKHERSSRDKEPAADPHGADHDHDNERSAKRDIDRGNAASSRSGDRNTDRNGDKDYMSAHSRGDSAKDQRNRDSQFDRRRGVNENRRNDGRRNFSEKYYQDRKDDSRRREDNRSKYELNKDRDSFRNKGNYGEDSWPNRHNHGSLVKDEWSRRNESSYDKNKGHDMYNAASSGDKYSNTSRHSRVGTSSNEKKNADYRDRHGKSKKNDDNAYSSFSSDSSDMERSSKNDISSMSTSFTRPERHYRGSKKK